MTALLLRLALAGIRSRLLASALTIAIAGAAAATIVLALEVRSSGRDPWQQTFDAANGAHVLASVPSQADARALAKLPGVTQRGAPVPLATTTVGPSGSAERVELAGLSGRTAVNRPVLTAGSPLREGGIVLERSLAKALGIEVGATLAVTGSRGPIALSVLGTAVVPSQPRYPRRNPGLAWVTPATLERVEPDRNRWRWTEALRLANPSAAAAFTKRAAAGFPATTLYFETWQDQRRFRAGRCTADAAHRDDVHHPAPDRRLRRGRDPRRRPRQR
jgi:putative ABC transport system permease protein